MRIFRLICTYVLVLAGASLVLYPGVDGVVFHPELTQFQAMRMYWPHVAGGFALFFAGMVLHPGD
jgi:hypothetical protein